MPVFGFLTPLIVLIGFLYFINETAFIFDNYFSNFGFEIIKLVDINLSLQSIIFYSYIAILTIISIINYKIKNIDPGKFFNVFFFVFIISWLVFFFVKNSSFEIIYIFAILLSFLLSFYLINIKVKWWGETIVLVLLGLMLWVRLFG